MLLKVNQRAEICSVTFKTVIFMLTVRLEEGQTPSKTLNLRHCSMRIRVKRKKRIMITCSVKRRRHGIRNQPERWKVVVYCDKPFFEWFQKIQIYYSENIISHLIVFFIEGNQWATNNFSTETTFSFDLILFLLWKYFSESKEFRKKPWLISKNNSIFKA